MAELPPGCCDAIKYLLSLVNGHAAYVYKLEENLTQLKGKWNELDRIRKDVESKIEEAERMGDMKRTNVVSGWLERVQEFQKMMEVIDQGSQEIPNICLSSSCLKKCVTNYELGKRVVNKMIPEVDALVEEGRHFLDKNYDIANRVPPQVVAEMPCAETVGLEVMLTKVWNCLEDENVGIIGLFGMGGAGKTTLMKRVHSELGKRKPQAFDIVLWVVVSKDGDVSNVMNDIRNRLGIRDEDWNNRSENERVSKIYRGLKHKRFVLMLDDLWGKLELEKLGVPHPKETGFQSKVIFTTRFEDLCDKMQAQKKLKVECLLEKEAFDLFRKKVGDETLKFHTEIPKLAQKMVKECDGLPLAIITLGSAMAGVKNVDAWKEAIRDLSSSQFTGPDLEADVYRILKFSYDKLPYDKHRNCFLYCALYPEDCVIDNEDLIDRWIGEGFLGEDKQSKNKSIYEMREDGKSIIEKLKLSCLLEDFISHHTWKSDTKMHDVIRDMALWLSRDQGRNRDKVLVGREAFVIDSKRLDSVERISIRGVEERWEHIPNCPNLLALCVQWRWDISNFSNLQYMTRLKVLDLSKKLTDIGNLPAEIGRLINLEYLNVSDTFILNRLPIELKNLKKLRVFLMESTIKSLEFFPLEVLESLDKLKVFRYSGRNRSENGMEEEALVDKLDEYLPKLEELGIRLTTINGVNKLCNSNKLQGCIRRLRLQGIKEELEMVSLLATLSRMKHLEYLSLWGLRNNVDVSSVTCDLSKLQEVWLTRCDSITHLTWLRHAPLLEFLHVEGSSSIEEVVKEGQDENLSTVELFSNLRYLLLAHLSLKSIYPRTLPFPSLKAIEVAGCDELKRLPLNSNSAKDTLIEITGEEEWWNDLEWEDPATKQLFQSKFHDRPFDDYV